MKNKLCAGEDNIPMKIAKDVVCGLPAIFCEFFNNCASKGIPARWKQAVITPLYKNGDRNKVTQYRPISNLDSLGKIYEKIILQRINDLGEMDGIYQHGFKEKRSTVTAMLEVQDFISSNLDAGKIVGTYSLDLSAAFDLLRPDQFLNQMRNSIPLNLLQTLMDFLSGCQFTVQLGKTRSAVRDLKVGCVQGSILGPHLFTLYMSNLPNILTDVHLISFADDSYISVAHKDINTVKSRLSEVMVVHDRYLSSIGMATNVSKTELIMFARKPIMDPVRICVNGTDITAKPVMKILGVLFDQNLGWTSHIEKVKQKARYVLLKMRYLRRYLDAAEMKKVITSHFFGLIYYASPVWLTEIMNSRIWSILNVLHYKALRIVCADFKRRKSRRELDATVERARPYEWMRFINVKTAVQLTLMGANGPPITKKLRDNLYQNDRTGRISFMDTSRLKIGRNSLQNRICCASEFTNEWLKGISDNRLRVELKKSFIKNCDI